jgi:hypothetical protein
MWTPVGTEIMFADQFPYLMVNEVGGAFGTRLLKFVSLSVAFVGSSPAGPGSCWHFCSNSMLLQHSSQPSPATSDLHSVPPCRASLSGGTNHAAQKHGGQSSSSSQRAASLPPLQASLEDLNKHLAHPIPMNRFRANILVAGAPLAPW